MIVLDSAALLAYFKDEPGAELAAACLGDGLVIAPTAGETIDHLVRLSGVDPRAAVVALAGLPVTTSALSTEAALAAGLLRARHYDRRSRRVSLIDCSLASTASQLGTAVVTSDRHLLDLCHEEGIDTIPLPNSGGETWEPS